MNKYFKLVLYGVLVWLIPFVVAWFFYTKDHELIIDLMFFKSIMVVVGGIVGSGMLVLYFKKTIGNYLKEGIVVGISWLIINILLDLIILIPISKMSMSEYFAHVGIKYLVIPATSIAMGLVLKNNNSNKVKSV